MTRPTPHTVAARNTEATVRFPLTLAAQLHKNIKRTAGKNNRTMNSEILARLEAYDFLTAELDRYRFIVDGFRDLKNVSTSEVIEHG